MGHRQKLSYISPKRKGVDKRIQNRHERSMLPISIATPFILSHLQFVSLALVTTLELEE